MSDYPDLKKKTKIAKPIHKTRFSGSPRKLKGKSRGRWILVGEGRWKWVNNGRNKNRN